MALRVLIADDHLVVVGGLRALLDTLDGFEVAGVAADGEIAVRESQLLRPDVVLMDVRVPGGRRCRSTGFPACAARRVAHCCHAGVGCWEQARWATEG